MKNISNTIKQINWRKLFRKRRYVVIAAALLLFLGVGLYYAISPYAEMSEIIEDVTDIGVARDSVESMGEKIHEYRTSKGLRISFFQVREPDSCYTLVAHVLTRSGLERKIINFDYDRFGDGKPDYPYGTQRPFRYLVGEKGDKIYIETAADSLFFQQATEYQLFCVDCKKCEAKFIDDYAVIRVRKDGFTLLKGRVTNRAKEKDDVRYAYRMHEVKYDLNGERLEVLPEKDERAYDSYWNNEGNYREFQECVALMKIVDKQKISPRIIKIDTAPVPKAEVAPADSFAVVDTVAVV